MGLNVYEATTEDLAALAKKLPVGRLYSNGKGFVPNVRQSLYSECIATLAHEPQAALAKEEELPLPVASGLPKTWDEIAPGHLVVAQEALDNGWWEAIVLDRNGDMLTLRFRDYPEAAQVCAAPSGSRADQHRLGRATEPFCSRQVKNWRRPVVPVRLQAAVTLTPPTQSNPSSTFANLRSLHRYICGGNAIGLCANHRSPQCQRQVNPTKRIAFAPSTTT